MLSLMPQKKQEQQPRRIPALYRLRMNFTILELMIVVGIIAILAALLLPALAKAREKAQSIQCMSNLKTLSLAMMNYADCFNGWGKIYNSADQKDSYYTPRYFFGPVSPGRFDKTLLPYVDNGKNYIVADDSEAKNHDVAPFAVCPAGRRDGEGFTAPNDGNMPNFSYSFNARLCFSLTMLNNNGYNKMSNVRRASWRVLVSDFSCVRNNGETSYNYRALHLMNQGNIARRHGSYANIAFVDGHVESWGSTRISTVSLASNQSNRNVSFWADYD